MHYYLPGPDGGAAIRYNLAAYVSFLPCIPKLTGFRRRRRSKKDLQELSHQGHYLKGSSATLGLIKIRDSCEKIQRYGSNENVDGSPEPDNELCLNRIKDTLKVLRADFSDVRKAMKRLYNEGSDEEDEGQQKDREDEAKKEEAVPEEKEKAADAENDTKEEEPLKESDEPKEVTEAKEAPEVKEVEEVEEVKEVKETAEATNATETEATDEGNEAPNASEKTTAVADAGAKSAVTA
jgi:chemotaxis protein histidine kinase CheA